MDWITTSGSSLDEAKSNALDQLGIVADEAEFDVINDVEKGIFGRIKTEAKIRARVRPRQPAPKDDRRSRNGSRSKNRPRKKGGGNQNRNRNGNGSNDQQRNTNEGSKQKGSRQENSGQSKGQRSNNGNGKRQGKDNGRQKGNNQAAAAGAAAAKTSGKKDTVESTISREEQETIATGFLEGVLTSFGMTGDVSVVQEPADDSAIEMAVNGESLGLLVGQKGATLSALQELTRTVVQRNAEGSKTDRLRVDVAGYRARRTAALTNFAQNLAQEVIDSGNEKLLEPMGPADRKVVHDALTDIDGVETGSEGEEPRRRVVIRPSA